MFLLVTTLYAKLIIIVLLDRVLNLKKRYKFFIVFLLILIVTIVSCIFKEPWMLVLYNLVLTLFVDEIKQFFSRLPKMKKIRISYSYLFRIDVGGNFLLVKDEQGRNKYQPVGGVYKYNAEEIDVDDIFNGMSDGLFNAHKDIKDDLRLIIDRNKLRKFKAWFSSQNNRENAKDLTREFKEELIDTNIVSADIFDSIKYSYIGSHIEKSHNNKLKIKQIRHFDVYKIKLTNAQRTYLEELMNQNSDKYLFATPDIIERGEFCFGGIRYEIADHTKLILKDLKKTLKNEINDFEEHLVKVTLKQKL